MRSRERRLSDSENEAGAEKAEDDRTGRSGSGHVSIESDGQTDEERQRIDGKAVKNPAEDAEADDAEWNRERKHGWMLP